MLGQSNEQGCWVGQWGAANVFLRHELQISTTTRTNYICTGVKQCRLSEEGDAKIIFKLRLVVRILFLNLCFTIMS